MATGAWLDLAGGRLAYTDQGARAPLLLVHGWPLDRSAWQPQADVFGAERRVVVPDLVGFGTSSGAGRRTMAAHAADLVALLDALAIPRAVVAGLSMGGYVALALALGHPERLAGLVLADTRAEADTPEQRAARQDLAELVAREGVGALAGRLLPRLLSTDARPDVRTTTTRIIEAQPAEGVVAGLGAMADRPDVTGQLPSLRAPTLVLVGAQDLITPPEAAETLARGIPGARLVVIPGAGHLANLEEPGAFNAALRGFLDEVDAGTAG
jgi:pimeloyl-ACP methyl ester carboxylesterase